MKVMLGGTGMKTTGGAGMMIIRGAGMTEEHVIAVGTSTPIVEIETEIGAGRGIPSGAAVHAVTATAVPYYAWANRGAAPMRVWLPIAR